MFRKLFIKITYYISRWIGARHFPYTHKLITAKHYHSAIKVLMPGDVLLGRTFGELTNLFIPGKYKHAALFACGVSDYPYAIEAIGTGVQKSDLIDFMLKRDIVGIYRMKGIDYKQSVDIVELAKKYIGFPYDYEFRSDNKAFYCSEFVYSCYKETIGERFKFEMWKRFGSMTVMPSDIARAEEVWQQVWSSED